MLSFFFALRSLPFAPVTKARTSKARPRYSRPSLEWLEARLVPADIDVWKGGSGDWGRFGNWTNGVPTNNSEVIIPSGSVLVEPLPAGAFSEAYSIQVAAGADLAVRGNLAVTTTITNLNKLTLKAGYTLAAGEIINKGTFDAYSGAASKIEGLLSNKGTATIYNPMIITGSIYNDGTLDIGNSANPPITVTVVGNFTQTKTATLEIAYHPAPVDNVSKLILKQRPAVGTAPPTGGVATLAGTLSITGAGGKFVPGRGSFIPLLYLGGKTPAEFATTTFPIGSVTYTPLYKGKGLALLNRASLG